MTLMGDIKYSIFNRDLWQCTYPGCTDMSGHIELAHRIAQSNANAKHIKQLYGITMKQAWSMLHHPLNMTTSCRNHNDYFNIGNNPESMNKLLEEIWSNISHCF